MQQGNKQLNIRKKKEKFFDAQVQTFKIRKNELRAMQKLIRKHKDLWSSQSHFIRSAIIRQIIKFGGRV